MRTLFVVGTLAGAVFVPWNSLTPLLTDVSKSRSEVEASPAKESKRPAARLCPGIGIVPVADDEDEISDATRFAAPATRAGKPAEVHCENGVCTIEPTRSGERGAAVDSMNGPAKFSPARARDDDRVELRPRNDSRGARANDSAAALATTLEQLRAAGMTRYQLETNDRGRYRFTCTVRQTDADGVASGLPARFSAEADSDAAAAAAVLEQIEERE